MFAKSFYTYALHMFAKSFYTYALHSLIKDGQYLMNEKLIIIKAF